MTSIDFNSVNTQNNALSQLPLYYGGNTFYLDSSAIAAYSYALQNTEFSNCKVQVSILASVTPKDSTKSNWFIGLAFVPLWPATPVNEIWTYTFNANIICNGNTVRKVHFIEHEQVEAFFYGIYRIDLANEASKAMHKKLIYRLKEELSPLPPTDFNNI